MEHVQTSDGQFDLPVYKPLLYILKQLQDRAFEGFQVAGVGTDVLAENLGSQDGSQLAQSFKVL